MADINLTHCVLLIGICIGAGFIQRVSGFGLGIFVMMFLPHFLSSHTAAVAISSLFSCATSTYNAIRYRKSIAYKTVLPMVVATLVCIPVAVHYAHRVSGKIFQILLGGVLILMSLFFLFFSKRIRMKPNLSNGILAGALGGTLNGLFSTGGPPAVLYLSSATADNITYFATIQFYFCFSNLYATAMRAFNGTIDGYILFHAAVGMIGCMAGDRMGKQIFDRLDSDKLKRIIYIGMIISGILLFL